MTSDILRLLEGIWMDGFTDCWHWSGYLCKGYGQINVNGKILYTHRFSYEKLRSPIPKNLVLDHLCRIPDCCNPWHLEPVTDRENVRRGKGNQNKGKTHCKRGHELVPENVKITTQGGRSCIACSKLYIGPDQRSSLKALAEKGWTYESAKKD